MRKHFLKSAQIARFGPVINPVFSLPFTQELSKFNNGGLPYPWRNEGTWLLVNGKGKNTPELGTEILTDGGMEINPIANWPNENPVTRTKVADERTGGSGTYSLDLARASGNSYGVAAQRPVGQAKKWYRFSAWLKNFDAIDLALAPYRSDWSALAWLDYSGLTWSEVVGVGRMNGDDTLYFYLELYASADGKHGRWDDVSMKAITTKTLFATLPRSLTADVVCKAAWEIPSWAPAGVVVRMDSPANPKNFILGYHEGAKRDYAKLVKCVDGTYTQLINVNVAHVAGAYVEVRTSGSDVALYYNGAQLGTTQTIADAGIVHNRIHGLFSTYEGNLVSAFSLEAN